jgi:hypothetical protein
MIPGGPLSGYAQYQTKSSNTLSENGDECFADITYSHTSIGSAGDEFVAKFTADYYQSFMQTWEKALNRFLRTGCRLTDAGAD